MTIPDGQHLVIRYSVKLTSEALSDPYWNTTRSKNEIKTAHKFDDDTIYTAVDFSTARTMIKVWVSKLHGQLEVSKY